MSFNLRIHACLSGAIPSGLLIALISILLFACVTEQKEKVQKKVNVNTSDKIVLTFKNSPEIDNSFQFSKGIIINPESVQISIFGSIDDGNVELPEDKIPDNIIIKAEKEYVILRHPVNYIDYEDYILMRGDSVSINYKNGRPVVSILNRKTLANDFDAENIARIHSLALKYSPVAEYFNARTLNAKRLLEKGESINRNRKLSIEQAQEVYSQQINSLKNDLYSKVQLFIRSESSILDSLKKKKLISNDHYLYYKNKIRNIDRIVRLETDHLSKKEVHEALNDNWERLHNYPPVYHSQLVEAFTDKFIAVKAKVIEIGDGRNRDFKQVYTIIDSSNIFLEKDKNYLLYRELKNVAETSSNEDFASYFRRYDKIATDKALIDKIRSDYSVKLSKESNEISGLILFDRTGEKFSFDAIKKRHAGKIMYVDFWASWCVPCRMALPQSVKLRNELKDKQIIFVYLSIDQTIKPWKTASNKEKLYDYPENYLVANYEASNFIKQQKLNTIPRYMIFDKKGKLTYSNAPRVESKELKALLIKLSKL